MRSPQRNGRAIDVIAGFSFSVPSDANCHVRRHDLYGPPFDLVPACPIIDASRQAYQLIQMATSHGFSIVFATALLPLRDCAVPLPDCRRRTAGRRDELGKAGKES